LINKITFCQNNIPKSDEEHDNEEETSWSIFSEIEDNVMGFGQASDK